MTKTVLAFSMGDVRLGLDASAVVEVIPTVKLVTPPEMPPLLRGFIAINGGMIPVIHLEKLLNGAGTVTAEMKLSDRLVIAKLGGVEVSWVASAAMEPISYRTRDTVPLPEDHVLNNCAERVLPLTPPLILLEPDRILLMGETLRLEQLRQRAEDRERLLMVETSDETL
ncbi:chemotaxis signal transduction protein [Prosthecobacter fusiformis]|uniref:Chemotaxis signal transduction protein n=1 Tax=Prosthecobacter fusiformis TaxID=48464 RepID=A0A4R7S277_9BACT|nr:chemotaxis protein CheW [Prosthecobacter fusiformis]TDU71345.1 chemotaxis signal transduction protein [Prosthecobacter fusiformis]